MKKLEYIIVHISDSSWGSCREIRKWHLDNGWRDVGYHFIILNGWILPTFNLPCLTGSIELGRDLDGDPFVKDNEIGAHALGYNDRSLGICGIGKGLWHPSQEASLIVLARCLMARFNIPRENVLGHCETDSGKKQLKTCPDLDMDKIRAEL